MVPSHGKLNMNETKLIFNVGLEVFDIYSHYQLWDKLSVSRLRTKETVQASPDTTKLFAPLSYLWRIRQA